MNITLLLNNNVLLNTVSTIAFRLSVLVVGIFFARNLGSELYGEFVLVRSTIQILETSFGISLGIVIAKVYLTDRVNFNGAFFFSFVILLLSFFIFFIFFYFFVDFNEHISVSYIVVAFYCVLTVFFQLILSFQKSISKFKSVFLMSILYFFSSVFSAYFLTSAYKVIETAFISYILSMLLSLMVPLYCLSKKEFIFNVPFDNLKGFKFLKVDALPIIFSSILSPVIIWLINFVISKSDNGLHNLSIFNVSYLLYGLMTFLPIVLAEVLFRKVSVLINDGENIWSFIFRQSIILLLLNVPVAIIFYVSSDFIISFYGDDFAESKNYLNIFLICSFFTCTLPLLGKVFILMDMSIFNLFSNLLWGVFVFIFIFLNIFVFNFDIVMACVLSFLLSYSLMFVLQWFILYKRLYLQ